MKSSNRTADCRNPRQTSFYRNVGQNPGETANAEKHIIECPMNKNDFTVNLKYCIEYTNDSKLTTVRHDCVAGTNGHDVETGHMQCGGDPVTTETAEQEEERKALRAHLSNMPQPKVALCSLALFSINVLCSDKCRKRPMLRQVQETSHAPTSAGNVLCSDKCRKHPMLRQVQETSYALTSAGNVLCSDKCRKCPMLRQVQESLLCQTFNVHIARNTQRILVRSCALWCFQHILLLSDQTSFQINR